MSSEPKRISVVVLGAGSRGTGYASFALEHPESMAVVGVAEPRDFYRDQLMSKHGISVDNAAKDWRELAKRKRFADAVVIATQDAMHVEPAVAFAKLGYHILLEKPMAPNAEDCRRIAQAAMKSGALFAVCHVLRYTSYTRKLKEIVDSGAIGEIVSMQHLEPVGYWHQAHSFVRGNWRNEKESSSMLLAKSCHDLDWIRYVMGARCKTVSSFGTLKHFRRECQPAGAADRCLECGVEHTCPYSAKKIYLERVIEQGHTDWPISILTTDMTEAGVLEALKSGPYGRCVYACDNDVVDNQVVNMLFEGGATASFTMTAFTDLAHRRTRIFGSRGMLTGDGQKIDVYDFLTDRTDTVDTETPGGSILGGHGGGDYGLMQGFVRAVAENDPSRILSGPEESLETHLMVFAAEQARRENRVVDLV